MADELSPARVLNALTESFLQQYLQENPDTKIVPVHWQGHRRCLETKALDAAAQTCINEIQERIEITDAAESPVIIRRICHRREAAFLAGTKGQKLIWTHARHLAFVFASADASKVSQALESQGMTVSMEPLTRAQALVCAAELADLEREAKRPLSQEQAQRYRLRRLKTQLIATLLERGR